MLNFVWTVTTSRVAWAALVKSWINFTPNIIRRKSMVSRDRKKLRVS